MPLAVRAESGADVTPPKRMQTATERDLEGAAERKKRHAEVPEYVCDDVTGQYHGEELREHRERRPVPDRISRLEEKHDSLVKVVGATREDVASMTGKLDAFLLVVESERKESHRTERVRIGSRAKVIVAVVGALGVAIGAVITALTGCV